MNSIQLKELLDKKVAQYNRPHFIKDDPICIPHSYRRKQDIEIAGFLAATLAWGQRKVIISKCKELMALMDYAPYEFVMRHQPADLKALLHFKHRTFNATDTLYFIHFLQQYYQQHDTLEDAFLPTRVHSENVMEQGLTQFYYLFFALPEAPMRTRKHIATPQRKSACKRLNMFLRWMVRQDDCGVDFGIWQRLSPHQLVCPCDVHVGRVARKLGLLQRTATDWRAALELTERLKALCPTDPVKYDFALFGLGVAEQF